MSLTREQSISQYGTEAYTGWGEVEAAADARTRGVSSGGSSDGSFNFEAEVDKAYEELGSYYNYLIEESQGDLNRALSRLQEDYETGKRQKMASFNLTKEAQNIAQEAFSTDAENAFRTLRTRQLARGISRTSAFQPTGERGIADVESTRLSEDINRGQERLDLGEKASQLQFDQSGELADVQLARTKEDLPREFERFKKDKEEERKLQAGQMALSRQQRAYQRFEAGLV